jgi:hypothetical protein
MQPASEPTRSYTIALHNHARDNRARVVALTWHQLLEKFRQRIACTDKLGSPAFSPAIYAADGAQRVDANVLGWSLLVFDLESGKDTDLTQAGIDVLVSELRTRRLAFCLYSTFSHTPQDPRLRLVLRPNRIVEPAEIQRALRGGVEDLTLCADPTCKNPSRIFFLPSAAPGFDPAVHVFLSGDGSDVDVDWLLASAPPEPRPAPPAPRVPVSARLASTPAIERARAYAAACPPAVQGQGGDAHTFKLAARLARGLKLDDESALTVLLEWNQGCKPPWTEEELAQKIRSARIHGKEPIGGLLDTVAERPAPALRLVVEEPPPPEEEFVGGRIVDSRVEPPPPASEYPGAPSAEYVQSRRTVAEIRDEQWPEPESLSLSRLPVTPLSENMLPEGLRRWIVSEAAELGCPLEFVAAPAMAAIGSTIGRQIGGRPLRHGSWIEYPNLWCLLVGDPTSKKSPAMRRALRPLERLAGEEMAKFDARKIENAKELIVAQAKRDNAKREIERQVQRGGDASDIATTLEALPEEPRPRRFITTDSSPEALGDLLVHNLNGMLVRRDEIAGMIQTWGAKGRESERTFYLSGWSGSDPYVVDRIGRGNTRIPAVCLSLVGTIQPGVFSTYLSGAVNGDMGSDGLVQRFQLAVWPDRLPPQPIQDRPSDHEGRELAYQIFNELANIDIQKLGAEQGKYDDTPTLHFEPGSVQNTVIDFLNDLETTWYKSSDHDALKSHGVKMKKAFVALALISHLSEWAFCGPGGPIGRSAVEKAIAWIYWLENHARRIYGCAVPPEDTALQPLSEKIRAGELGSEFTTREIKRKHWAGLADTTKIEAALRLLADAGWIRTKRAPGAGRARFVHVVNPAITRRSNGDQ